MTKPCPACDATGKHLPDPESDRYVICPSCQGRGWFVPCFCCREPISEDDPCAECCFDRNSWRTYCETHRETFFHESEEP